MDKITMGSVLFYANLAEYSMIDQTMQLEARITKVTIVGVFEFKDETTKYMFDIGLANIRCEEKQLFATEEEARAYIQEKIDIIPVLVDMQIPVSDVLQEVVEGAVNQQEETQTTKD